MTSHRLTPSLVIIAIALFVGCESGYEPSSHDRLLDEYAQELIPLGEDNTWTYTVTHIDRTSNKQDTSTITESNGGLSESMSKHVVKEWDSLTRTWIQTGNSHRFEHDGWGYTGYTPFVYTPYDNGTERGLRGGFYREEEGLYWFTLPRNPVVRQFSELTLYAYHPHASPPDTTWTHYTATLEPDVVTVTVPAGTFSCYKLTLTSNAENGVNSTVYSSHENTIYLSLGTGVIKREMIKKTIHEDEKTNEQFTVSDDHYVYDLVSWDFHRMRGE